MSKSASLVFYICMFTISAFFFSFRKSRNRIKRNIGFAIAILIPSVIAGMRYRVGTDWDNYYFSMSIIRNTPFSGVFANRFISNAEYGYRALVKFFSYFAGNGFIFGMFGFITLAFIIDALIKDYKGYDTTLSFFMFLFIYFGTSFNLMRQTLAAAIVFWGMKYVYKGEGLKYFTTCIIASTIHMTATLALPIYFLWDKKEEKALKLSYFLPISAAVGIMVIFWRRLLTFALGSGFKFIQKYAGYLNNNAARNRDFL